MNPSESYDAAWSHEGLSDYDEWKCTPPPEDENGFPVVTRRIPSKRRRGDVSRVKLAAALRRVVALSGQYQRRHGEKHMVRIQKCADGQYIVAWAPDLVRALELLGDALEES